MNRVKRVSVVFVGSFQPAADGTVGGQMQACRTLLRSPISDEMDWHLIDTTMRSLPPPGVHLRIFDALKRHLLLVSLLLFQKVDTVLVFCNFLPLSLADKGLACVLARLFRKRVVLSLRTEVTEPSQRGRWFRALVNIVLRSCDVVICQSPVAANSLGQYGSCRPSQLRIVRNWLDPADYGGQHSPRNWRRADAAGCTLLFVGFLERFKGTHCLMEAVRLLRDRGRRFRLVLCGGGSERAALEERCRTLGLASLVEFRGWVTGAAKAAAYQDADIFVLPTWKEGLPNVLLEAMAWGLPLVTTPVGGIPFIVQSERNGLFVEPNAPGQLADALEALMLDRARAIEMGRRNRQTTLQRHDIGSLWREVAAILAGDERPRERSLAA